ncbi:MAG: hypothetical protein JXQ96_14815 [Cyclobacteriaceae bacterium]
MASCGIIIPDFTFKDVSNDLSYNTKHNKNQSKSMKLLSNKPKRHNSDHKGMLESFFGVDMGLGI